jgi:hypothetical protein
VKGSSWGYTITESSRSKDAITFNVRISFARLVVLAIGAARRARIPLRKWLVLLAALAVVGVRKHALALAAFAVVAALVLAGCPMPAPDGCSPGARRCHEDTPQVCSPGQRWTPADVRCATVGGHCEIVGGVPACLPGGAP